LKFIGICRSYEQGCNGSFLVSWSRSGINNPVYLMCHIILLKIKWSIDVQRLILMNFEKCDVLDGKSCNCFSDIDILLWIFQGSLVSSMCSQNICQYLDNSVAILRFSPHSGDTLHQWVAFDMEGWLLHAKFHPIGTELWCGPQNSFVGKFGNINAPLAYPFTILVKFSGFVGCSMADKHLKCGLICSRNSPKLQGFNLGGEFF